MDAYKMETASLSWLVASVQSYDPEIRNAALAEIRRRGCEYEDLHEEFNS